MRRWALVLLASSLGCAAEPTVPLGTLTPQQAEALVLERDDARDAMAARERELLGVIAERDAEISDLRAQLGMAEVSAEEAAERAARYEQGLTKAVATLNQVSQERAAPAPSSATAPRRLRSERIPTADISYYSDPRVSIVDRSVAASGRLFNSGDAVADGTLYIDLLRDGVVVDTKTQQFQVGGNSWGSWQEEFRITPSQASFSVQARLDY